MSDQANVPQLDLESERTCWICFATESENRRATWLHPCQCRGSIKWVHESCLYRWIDEKQNGNSRMKVACMQCRVEYIIIFPQVGRLALFLERTQDLVRQCSPFVAASAFLGSVYWTAVTYGGITVLQVYGQKRGMEMMEKGDPFFLLIVLPSIPVALILTRLIRWEDAVLRLWHNRRNILRKLPLVKWLFNAQSDNTANVEDLATSPLPDDPVDFSRIFCGAILLPSIATGIGKLLYGSRVTRFQSAILGGFTYIALKGIFKIYLRQKQYLHKTRRHIVDYTNENVRIYASSGQDNQPQSGSQADIRQYAGSEDNESEWDEGPDVLEELEAITSGYITASTSIASELDDVDADDLRDHVVVAIPNGPYTLFLA